jgi:hypothetical protein
LRDSKGLSKAIVSVVLGVGAIMGITLHGAAGAIPLSAPLFPQCPAVGHDTGCQELITISAGGKAKVATDHSQPAIDNQEDTLVGIVNNSNALVSSVALSGKDIFGFDGDGLCGTPGACTSPTEYGPTGYEGPETSFAVTAGQFKRGSVNFTGNLAPGATGYFSLEQRPFKVSSATLLPDITLTVPPLTGVEGLAITGDVATFADGPSTAPASEFSAAINWGDGSTGVGTVSQTGSGAPYVVTASHDYAEEGTYAPGVTVTDTQLPAVNTATGSGSAVIADAPITVTSEAIVDQTTSVPFTVPVATFTDGNPQAPLGDSQVSIDWGDGFTSSGTVQQPGGTGTVFDVSGSHTYSGNGTFTVGVTVRDAGGATAATADSVTVADAVVTCTGSGCAGSVTTSTQSVQFSSASTTGTILASIDPYEGDFTCGDPFRHAPEVTSVTDSGLGANILFTITFANSSAAGQWWVPFAVCYQSVTPFNDLFGHSVTTGLLPTCGSPGPGQAAVAPCVQSISEQPLLVGNVVEKVVVPPGDPRFH